MANEKKSRNLTNPGGIFSGISNQLKLIVRLMADRRINPLIKLLPLGTLAYLITPDLVPGPIDDAMIIWLGTAAFVELCPPDIVKEHLDDLKNTLPGEWRDKKDSGEDVIIDTEYKDLD
ncbi:MAG: hypothetical protein HUU38_26275 [Anaerolineales bacterium]|nr:hypothetical protein [Anaerolineales bacterium]